MPAKRAYGMDQDFYPWSPIVTRPIVIPGDGGLDDPRLALRGDYPERKMGGFCVRFLYRIYEGAG